MPTTSIEMERTVGEPSSPAGCLDHEHRHRHRRQQRHLQPRHRRHRVRRADRKVAASRLNDLGASLIDHGECDGAIEVLRDSVEVLTAKKDGLHGGYSFEVAKAESRLSRARRDRRARDDALDAAGPRNGGGNGSVNVNVNSRRRRNKPRRGGGAGGADDDDWASGGMPEDRPFSYASPIKVSPPSNPAVVGPGPSSSDVVAGTSSVGSQGLLAVILYNLALAHNVAGFKSGRQSLIDKASSLYKMSESVLLQQANSSPKSSSDEDGGDDDEEGEGEGEDPDGENENESGRESLTGVDVTYLARAIVNNMGMILFEWGKPDAGREYFDGLTSICFDGDIDGDGGIDGGGGGGGARGYDGEDAGMARRGGRRGSRWNAFEVNALIARGVNTSPAA